MNNRNSRSSSTQTGILDSLRDYISRNQRLREQKDLFRKQFVIPDIFKVPGSEDVLIDPVLMPCGHCFNRSTVKSQATFTCPVDQNKHQAKDFIISPSLQDIVAVFQEERSKVSSVINQLSESNQKTTSVEVVRSFTAVNRLAIQFLQSKKQLLEDKELQKQAEEECEKTPFIDEVTFQPFTSPVLTKYGFVCEEKILRDWVAEHKTCPFSRQPLTLRDLQFANSEDKKLEDEVKQVLREYQADHDEFVRLKTSRREITERELETYRTRTQEKIDRFEKVRQTKIQEAKKQAELIKELLDYYKESGLSSVLDISEPIEDLADIISQIRSEDRELVLLLHDGGEWVHRYQARDSNQPFIEDKEIAKKFNDCLIEICKLDKSIREAKQEDKAQIKNKINEIKLAFVHVRLLGRARKKIKDLNEAYRASGLPYPPHHPDDVDDQVLSKSAVWEDKRAALEQKHSFTEDRGLCEERRQFHRDIYTLYTEVQTAPGRDEAYLRQKINRFREVHRSLTERAGRLRAVQVQMNEITTNLKINLHNEADFIFWSNETRRCFHGYGGMDVMFNNPRTGETTKYKIPTRIHELMRVANTTTPLQGMSSFLQRLDYARSHNPRWTNNPFALLTRKASVKEIYDAEDLRNVNLNQPRR